MKKLLFALMLMFSANTWAAGLQVSPIRIEIPQGEQSRQLWLSNVSPQSIQVQVRVYEWSQSNGQETLTPTTALLATPAVTQILPNQRQLIRVVSPSPNTTNAEKTYRLMVEELPSPEEEASASSALNLLLSYSLPVFLHTSDPQPLDVSKLTFSKEGQKLRITNNNTSRLMLSDVRAGQNMLQAGLSGYVLAGQSMLFDFDVSAVNELRFTVNQSFDVVVNLTTGQAAKAQ